MSLSNPAIHACLLSTQTQVNQVVLGKERAIHLAMVCLLAKGHLLIEDQPGVGKTLLASALAHCMGLSTKRVQFASDLMPSDLTGAQIYRKDLERFEFKPGPLFTQVLLADEINRAPSKTQSALLQAMEEHEISVDGDAYALPAPFFVIGTQNPLSQIGTFPLPESQLDRFLMCIQLGLPNAASERALLAGQSPREALKRIAGMANAEVLIQAQTEAANCHLSETLLDYVQSLIAATRTHPALSYGLSPRGALALVAAAKAHAWLKGQSFATPDNVQSVWTAVVAHRLALKHPSNGGVTQSTAHMIATKEGSNEGSSTAQICEAILRSTPLHSV